MLFEKNPQLAIDTAALARILCECPVGETVTFRQMSRAIGRDVRKRYFVIQRARDAAKRETGAVFINVYRVGYQRLSAADAATIGANARRRVRSTTRRAAEAIRLAVSFANDLPEKDRARASAEMDNLRMVNFLARDRHVSTIVRKGPAAMGQTLMEMGRRMGLAAAA